MSQLETHARPQAPAQAPPSAAGLPLPASYLGPARSRAASASEPRSCSATARWSRALRVQQPLPPAAGDGCW
ncbi:MAG: hypothetical protein R3F62_24075 [Planctomycetota bacterium]